METMDVNGKMLQVISLLGKGKGGYSYLVSDGQKQYVLMHQLTAGKRLGTLELLLIHGQFK